jgi:hypothetical protein
MISSHDLYLCAGEQSPYKFYFTFLVLRYVCVCASFKTAVDMVYLIQK